MTENQKKEQPISIAQMSIKYNMTKQAIYLAIRKGHLKAQFKERRWYSSVKDWDEYRAMKYSRERSVFEGKPLYNKDQEELSVRQAAKMFGLPEQKVYYNVRTGRIPSFKRGSAIILRLADCMSFFGEDQRQTRFA